MHSWWAISDLGTRSKLLTLLRQAQSFSGSPCMSELIDSQLCGRTACLDHVKQCCSCHSSTLQLSPPPTHNHHTPITTPPSLTLPFPQLSHSHSLNCHTPIPSTVTHHKIDCTRWWNHMIQWRWLCHHTAGTSPDQCDAAALWCSSETCGPRSVMNEGGGKVS